MIDHTDEAAYCARVIRHAALGAVIGGPVAAAPLWIASGRVPALKGLTATDAATMPLLVGIGALLVGVWLGAVIVCIFAPLPTVEDKCYGAGFGCLIYLVGGALALLVGTRLLDMGIHPLTWYLIGGTVLALAALALAIFSPHCREKALHRPEGADTEK